MSSMRTLASQLGRYQAFLAQHEVDEILGWLDHQPYTKEKKIVGPSGDEILQYRNKNIDLQYQDSVVGKILYPKLREILDDPVPTHSVFLESHFPFSLHVDTEKTFDRKEFYATKSNSTDRSLLVSLNQSTDFQTVFFDFFTDDLAECFEGLLVGEHLPAPCYPGVNDLSHLSNRDRQLLEHHAVQCTDCYTWQCGEAISWPRAQLHCSSNFYGKGIKQALVMFF